MLSTAKMKHIKLLLFFFLLFVVESVILTLFIAPIFHYYIRPDVYASLAHTMFFLFLLFIFYKCAIELLFVFLLACAMAYKLEVEARNLIVSRSIPAIIMTVLLIALAFDESRGIDIFLLSPLLYLPSLAVPYFLFRSYSDTIINWINSRS